MNSRHLLRVFHREFQAVFITAYSLMLRSVIHIGTLYRFHKRSKRDIYDKYNYPQQTFKQSVKDRHVPKFVCLGRDVLCHQCFYSRQHAERQEEKQAYRQRDAEYDGKNHHHVVYVDFEFLCHPLFKFARLSVVVKDFARPHQGLHTHCHRPEKVEHTSYKRYAIYRRTLACRSDVSALDNDVALFVADSCRHRPLSAHHYSFQYGLTAYF